jgi:hypothetical protein
MLPLRRNMRPKALQQAFTILNVHFRFPAMEIVNGKNGSYTNACLLASSPYPPHLKHRSELPIVGSLVQIYLDKVFLTCRTGVSRDISTTSEAHPIVSRVDTSRKNDL